MSHPIVIAYHLIWTCYGWWLPNDPRGSSSHTIRCDILNDNWPLHEGHSSNSPCANALRAVGRYP